MQTVDWEIIVFAVVVLAFLSWWFYVSLKNVEIPEDLDD